MYRRTRMALARRFQNVALRVSCWNLPPVATHLACFLAGTLLFEPDSSGKVPPGILMPWTAARIEGGVRQSEEYQIIDRGRNCLLLEQRFRIWQSEPKKVFVLLPKSRLLAESISVLQRADAHLSPPLKSKPTLPACEKKNVIIYP